MVMKFQNIPRPTFYALMGINSEFRLDSIGLNNVIVICDAAVGCNNVCVAVCHAFLPQPCDQLYFRFRSHL